MLYIDRKPVIKGTKTVGSTRVVDVMPEIIDIIDAHQTGTEYVVTMTPNSIGKAYRRVLERNHLPVSRFHDLRHAFVSVLTDHQVNAEYIMANGGWSSDRVMRSTYLQRSAATMNEAKNEANAIFSGLLQKAN